MVRNPKPRSTKKYLWSSDDLIAAVEAIKTGRKIREVGREFGIPESTIRTRMSKGDFSKPHLGRKPVFTRQQEEDIFFHALTLSRLFYGLTMTGLRRLAFEFASKNNISHHFSLLTKQAGYDWTEYFLKRHPHLTVRKTDPASQGTIMKGFNRTVVRQFYTKLKAVWELYHFTPCRVFNVDETIIKTVQKTIRVNPSHRRKQINSSDVERITTVICAMSPSGIYIPPMFIFENPCLIDEQRRGGPQGSIYHSSASISTELFATWLEHFVSKTKSSAEDPTLLILDTDSSHCSIQAFEYARENGVVMLCLPPYMNHKLQPLEISFFSQLKAGYREECQSFMIEHLCENIVMGDVPKIFKVVYERCANIDNAVFGFDNTGIYPLNPDIFTDLDFAAVEKLLQEEVEGNKQSDENISDSSDEGEVAIDASNTRYFVEGTSGVSSISQNNSNQPTQEVPLLRIASNPLEDFLTQPEIKIEEQDIKATIDSTDIFKHEPESWNCYENSNTVIDELQHNKNVETDSAEIITDIITTYGENEKRARNIKTVKDEAIDVDEEETVKRVVVKVEPHFVDETEIRAVKRTVKVETSDDNDEEIIPKLNKICDPLGADEKPGDDLPDSRGNPPQKDKNVCAICSELGQDNELWYRCRCCSAWVHTKCIVADSVTLN